jgi:hypothetical protein
LRLALKGRSATVDPLGASEVAIDNSPVIVCDAVESLAVHNGVVRLRLSRLTAEGASAPALELLAPVVVVAQIIAALQTVKV